MGYANLVNQACASKAELFCRLRDFICALNGTYADYSLSGIGWTLHDSSYAVDADNPGSGDWFVVKSNGEGGLDDLYFRFTWTAGYIQMHGFLYWDATTHAGTHQYSAASNFYIADTGSYTLSIYGDLDFIILFETTNTTYDYMVYGGKLASPIYDGTIAQASSALSAGTDVSITVDVLPADWAVGRKIYIRENGTIEIAAIKTLDAATKTITVDLANSYAAAKLSSDLGYACQSSYISMDMVVAANRTTAAAETAYKNYVNLSSRADPDELNSVYAGVPIYIQSPYGHYGQVPHMAAVANAGLSIGDVLATESGDSYRYFQYYTSFYLLVKEV